MYIYRNKSGMGGEHWIFLVSVITRAISYEATICSIDGAVR